MGGSRVGRFAGGPLDGLNPRLLCNITYAYLTARLDPKQREAFDADLHAPPGGWDAADAALQKAILTAGEA